MAITLDEYMKVRADPAVVALAHDVLSVTDSMQRHPGYQSYLQAKGPDATNRDMVTSGLAAVTEYLSQRPGVSLGEDMRAKARLRTFNAVQSIVPALSPGEVERVATLAVERMSQAEQARVAMSGGTVLPLIQDVVKADPATAARRSGEAGPSGESAGAAGAGGQWINGRWVLGALKGDPASGLAPREERSGGSYRDLPDSQNSYGPEKLTYTQMSTLATNLGIPWAMNAPDLLKLGPAALKEIAASGFKRESYNLLAKDVGIGAKDIVGVAKLARARGLNADEFTKGAEPVIKENSDTPADEKDTWRKMSRWGDALQSPKATQAEKDAAEDAVRAKVTRMLEHHPEHRDQILKGVVKPLKLEIDGHNAARKATAGKVATADAKGSERDKAVATADAAAAAFMQAPAPAGPVREARLPPRATPKMAT